MWSIWIFSAFRLQNLKCVRRRPRALLLAAHRTRPVTRAPDDVRRAPAVALVASGVQRRHSCIRALDHDAAPVTCETSAPPSVFGKVHTVLASRRRVPAAVPPRTSSPLPAALAASEGTTRIQCSVTPARLKVGARQSACEQVPQRRPAWSDACCAEPLERWGEGGASFATLRRCAKPLLRWLTRQECVADVAS